MIRINLAIRIITPLFIRKKFSQVGLLPENLLDNKEQGFIVRTLSKTNRLTIDLPISTFNLNTLFMEEAYTNTIIIPPKNINTKVYLTQIEPALWMIILQQKANINKLRLIKNGDWVINNHLNETVNKKRIIIFMKIRSERPHYIN